MLPRSRRPRRSAAATGSSPSSSPQVAHAGGARGEQDRPSRAATTIAEHLATGVGRARATSTAFVPLSALTGDGRRRAASASSRPGCPRARTTTPTASSAISPRRSSRPSCCARSCSRSTRDELPHSIAVTDRGDRGARDQATGRCSRSALVVRVERDSQKGIVIGRGGAVLRQAGTAARLELEALLGVRVHLETHVRGRPRLAAPAGVARPPRALNRLWHLRGSRITPRAANHRVAIRRIGRCRVAARCSPDDPAPRERLDVGPHATAPARSRDGRRRRDRRRRARELRRQPGPNNKQNALRPAGPYAHKILDLITPVLLDRGRHRRRRRRRDDLRRAAVPGEARARSAARSRCTATPCSRSAGRSSPR